MIDFGFLNEIEVRARLMVLSGVSDDMHLRHLRSAWGAALEGLEPDAYCRVMEGLREENSNRRPGYALADLGNDAGRGRRIRCTLAGSTATAYDTAILGAWKAAGVAGLGDRRTPFAVTDALPLGPSGQPLEKDSRAWPLGMAEWPLPGDPARTPCRLEFPGGLHLRTKRSGRWHFERPSRFRIVEKACLRIGTFLPPASQNTLAAAQTAWHEETERFPMDFGMTPSSTYGWSRRQENCCGDGDKEYRCWLGHIDLPAGPGSAWPLLLAVSWLGLGHHFTEGMGWFRIVPLD